MSTIIALTTFSRFQSRF